MAAFTPCSLKYFIIGLFFGKPLKERNKSKLPSSCSFLSSDAIFTLASANSLVDISRCAFTISSTRGRNISYNWSSPLGTGPDIINGVRASSINTESTSSTIEKLCLRCTKSRGEIAMLSLR